MPTLLIIDANLTVLLAVGLTNRSYIAKHKRLAGYDQVDFDNVTNIIAASSGLLFSPNVLSETSNLIRYLSDPMRSEVSGVFAGLIMRTTEIFVPSPEAVKREEHIRLGLTDSVLLIQARSGATLLTVDLDLYLAASSAGLNAINYNHIKDQRPDYR